jgi:hypothetical protein
MWGCGRSAFSTERSPVSRSEGLAADHSFTAAGRREAVRPQRDGLNQTGDHAAAAGVMTGGEHALRPVPSRAAAPRAGERICPSRSP